MKLDQCKEFWFFLKLGIPLGNFAGSIFSSITFCVIVQSMKGTISWLFKEKIGTLIC